MNPDTYFPTPAPYRGTFSFNINNDSDAAVRVAISPGYFDTKGIVLTEGAPNTAVEHYHSTAALVAAGFDVDCVCDDGTIMTDVTCTASKQSQRVRDFIRYATMYPLVASGLVVQCSSSTGFTQELELTRVRPMQKLGETSIKFSDFQYVTANLATKINITGKSIEIGRESVIILEVPANTDYTLTFQF